MLRKGFDRQVIIAVHGNTLRALVKFPGDVSDKDIVGRSIPTGIPQVYEQRDDLRPIRNSCLGEEAAQTPIKRGMRP